MLSQWGAATGGEGQCYSNINSKGNQRGWIGSTRGCRWSDAEFKRCNKSLMLSQWGLVTSTAKEIREDESVRRDALQLASGRGCKLRLAGCLFVRGTKGQPQQRVIDTDQNLQWQRCDRAPRPSRRGTRRGTKQWLELFVIGSDVTNE